MKQLNIDNLEYYTQYLNFIYAYYIENIVPFFNYPTTKTPKN
ncbi:hypothetical protein CCAN2_1880033 [Capnocytophaga canimorsus]|nr:hypothetical protein CCAN2_1880033 [Capnocytophaga canimorsus]